jgi:hypothetical protein
LLTSPEKPPASAAGPLPRAGLAHRNITHRCGSSADCRLTKRGTASSRRRRGTAKVRAATCPPPQLAG